jgi:hypothetical protein
MIAAQIVELNHEADLTAEIEAAEIDERLAGGPIGIGIARSKPLPHLDGGHAYQYRLSLSVLIVPEGV